MLGYDCFIHANSRGRRLGRAVGLRHRRGARLRRVLLDKNCKIEPGCVIGDDAEADRARFPFVTESGIVVLPKGTVVPADGPDDPRQRRRRAAPQRARAAGPAAARDSFAIARHQRHSYESAGPRFKRYGADGALELAPHADVRGPGAGDLVDEPS
jgi:glucose-1-phosphate adenylyltransferase